MSVNHLALVVESRRISGSQVNEVAAAIQRQITRDFSPIWRLGATIDAFRRLDEVPPGYWPLLVRDNLPMKDVIGIHLDNRGQPYALIRSVPHWPFVASHEALEMIADPTGNRLVPGGSLKPGQGLVDYIVEVCDPCAAPRFGYSVNGILVSDFITPHYYDPMPAPGVRYSFSGAIDRPRGVLPDGYVAWRDPSTMVWWRAQRMGSGETRFFSLGTREFTGRPLRQQIDEDGALPVLYQGIPDDDPAVVASRIRYESSRAASRANAAALEAQIAAMLPANGRPPAPAASAEQVPVPWSRRGDLPVERGPRIA